VTTVEFHRGPRDGAVESFREPLRNQIMMLPTSGGWCATYRLATMRGGVMDELAYVFVGYYNRVTKERA
jgi:hypothetical protein